MRKNIYIAALAVLSLTACSNTVDEIFDQSAAERLEQYKQDYAEVLTENGGLWSMEYFSNSEEEGYVFVMKFKSDNSVEVSANHKWIGGSFKQETSIWKMIADNGPVLSFNSYNTLFHIFSDPANITGTYAPTGDSGDIDETGYGHEGDYEFQVMSVSEDHNTVRMLGKKRMYNIYMHRLDENTDIQQYLADVAAVPQFIAPYFGYFNLLAADGEPFIMSALDTGIPSVYPKNGDEVSQTRSGNIIFTLDGIRFMSPLEVPRADESAGSILLETFKFQDDGSLLAEDGTKIIGPYPLDVFFYETFDYNWYFDLENARGALDNLVKTLAEDVVTAFPTRTLESVYFGYEVVNGETYKSLNVKISGTRAASYYLDFTSETEDNIAFQITGNNSQANTLENRVSSLANFVEEIAKLNYSINANDIMSPVVISLTDNSNSNNVITLKIQ